MRYCWSLNSQSNSYPLQMSYKMYLSIKKHKATDCGGILPWNGLQPNTIRKLNYWYISFMTRPRNHKNNNAYMVQTKLYQRSTFRINLNYIIRTIDSKACPDTPIHEKVHVLLRSKIYLGVYMKNYYKIVWSEIVWSGSEWCNCGDYPWNTRLMRRHTYFSMTQWYTGYLYTCLVLFDWCSIFW